MRLVTYVDAQGAERSGAFIEEDRAILDLQRAHQEACGGSSRQLSSVLALIESGPEAMSLARTLVEKSPREAVLSRGSVKLRAPIQPPPQMRDALCFELHLRQSFAAARRLRAGRAPDPEAALKAMDARADERVLRTFQSRPIYYKCNRFAVVGADDDVVWPSFTRALDFELELACYIGRRAKDVPREQARSLIAGYTIFNDMSARDEQALEMPGMLGPAKSKDFDTANVMGPCLVTADEIEDPYGLAMIARVNGEEWGRGSTGDMRWRFEDVIAHITRSETLYPGEALGSGTVGNGCGLEQMRFLQPGDVVELEIEKIGVLRSKIVKP